MHLTEETNNDPATLRLYVLQHYAVFLAVYCAYGYAVCPYLDDLTLLETIIPAFCAVAVHFAVRVFAKPAPQAQSTPGDVQRAFWIDFLGFSALGAALAAFNFYWYGFPAESGGKVVFAFCVLGYFIAVDIGLKSDLLRAKQLRTTGDAFKISQQFMPYQTRLVLFSTVNSAVVGIAALMVTLKDLVWARSAELSDELMQLYISIDVLFVIGVIFAYNYRTIKKFAEKINVSLIEETTALVEAQKGQLTSQVTVFSNDEFGHLAMLTNATIDRLRELVEEVSNSRSAIIRCLVSLSSKRDEETGLHLIRTQMYVRLLAEHLQKNPKYKHELTAEALENIVEASPLHDIGKVGIPDAILQKPGKLTDAEFKIMQTHASLGAEALSDAEIAAHGSEFLRIAADIARGHHEKWDGSGYPLGLSGSQIPLAARIMAVSDVYDALRSKRVYKPAKSHEVARQIIIDGAGSHFDPDVVDSFLFQEEAIKAVAEEFGECELLDLPDLNDAGKAV